MDTTAQRWAARKNPYRRGCSITGSPRSGVRLGAFEEAALLVFLSGATGARIIATHLGSCGDARLTRRGGPFGAVCLAPPRLRGGCGRDGALGTQVHPANAHFEELFQDHLFQMIHHLLEHIEGFLLVLGQWIPLTVAAKTDAFLEVVHVQQMIRPQLIDAPELAVLPSQTEEDPAFEAVEELGSHLALALRV